MSARILFVDDEPNVLRAIERQLRRRYDVETAEGGEAGLAALRERGPYAVVVSDMRMPGMDGAHFLASVKEVAPQTTRVMLTGASDQRTAVEAVNEGNIFRFLTKPCSTDALTDALDAAVRQHELVTAERELLERTLQGAVKVLTDVLSLISPAAFSRASRVHRLVQEMAAASDTADTWHIEVAALLSQVGCITLPDETLDRIYGGETLTAAEEEMFAAHPQVGRDLIANVPRLEAVAEIIAYQNKRFDGGGTPHDGVRGEQIPPGARLLKLALDVDALLLAGVSERLVPDKIRGREGWYEPAAVRALERAFAARTLYEKRTVAVDELAPGMVLAEDALNAGGVLIVGRGQEVTSALLTRLLNLSPAMRVAGPVVVLVPAGDAAPRRTAA